MRVLIKNVIDQSEGRPAADESGSSRFHVRRSAHQLMTARIAPYVRSLCTSAAAPYLCFPPSVASLGDGLMNGRLVICALGGKKLPRHPAGEHAGIPDCIPRTRLLTGVPGKSAPYCASARLCCSMQGEREDGEGMGGGLKKMHAHAAGARARALLWADTPAHLHTRSSSYCSPREWPYPLTALQWEKCWELEGM